jgi:hypothetical protein
MASTSPCDLLCTQYGELRALRCLTGLQNVDVQLATVPPFWHIPVTPSGMLPLASYPSDLARPADPTPVIGSTRPFSYRSAGQRYLIMVNAVYTSSSSTTIAWTILSMEPGRGLQAASTPPFADAAPPHRAYNPISAGGPQIKIGAGRSVLRARLVRRSSPALVHWNAYVQICDSAPRLCAGLGSRCM